MMQVVLVNMENVLKYIDEVFDDLFAAKEGDYVTLAYADDKKTKLLLMLLLSIKMTRTCSYCLCKSWL